MTKYIKETLTKKQKELLVQKAPEQLRESVQARINDFKRARGPKQNPVKKKKYSKEYNANPNYSYVPLISDICYKYNKVVKRNFFSDPALCYLFVAT